MRIRIADNGPPDSLICGLSGIVLVQFPEQLSNGCLEIVGICSHFSLDGRRNRKIGRRLAVSN